MMINKSGTLKLFAKEITLDSSTGKIKGSKVEHLAGDSSSSKQYQAELADAVVLQNYDGKEEKPKSMKDEDFKSFKDSKFKKKMLTKPTTVKRLCGGNARPAGRYVSLEEVPTGLEGKIRNALLPSWGNEAS